MCRLLIRNVDDVRQGTYDKDDVVVIVPDDHVFSDLETSTGRFTVVDLPDKTIEEMAYLLEEKFAPAKPNAMAKIPKLAKALSLEKAPIGRRKHKIDPTTKQITRKAN